MMDQNHALIQGRSATAGPAPQNLAFSADGKTLYVGNNGDGSVSVFSVSNNLTLH
jgi:DNA-binding beta-propeller fold protein YncE